MSTTVDNRVVEMRFDNKQFEQNVQTSLSTLEKLKKSLNLSGAAKGLSDIDSAAKKVDMRGLGNAVDIVSARFSALQVMGVTALANITNSAVNAGKRIVSALTIDPIKTGFSEYETKINAVQTIMSNTASKGTTMADVTRVLDELNTYADKTIYNFAEMTKNIGTFTAAGVGLEEAASAIQGISNLAAASGSTSQQAATAMYQLSQALSSGTVKLMDWNSVVNAGMGGEKFQEALKATAREHGVAVDEMIKKNGSFRDSLHEEWITADILNETLNKFTVDGAKNYAKAMMESGKWTQEQADALITEAQAMEDAATKVKTFTQLWDTLKESAQSGWAKTWELIFGDFEEAKEFFTVLSEKLGGVIEKLSEGRNKLIEGAMGGGGSKWDSYIKKVNKAGIETEDFQNSLIKVAKKHDIAIDDMIKKEGSFEATLSKGWLTKDILVETLEGYTKGLGGASESTEDMTAKLKKFQEVVNDVWRGDYKNGQERVEALTKAGYEYAEVQDLVNKTVDGHKLTLEDLSDAQLKNVGYTDEQIKAIRELENEAKKTGSSVDDMIASLTKPSGRELFLGSITNIIEAMGKPLKAIKEAWDDTFGKSITSDNLYKLIEGFNQFTESLIMSDGTAEKFKTTFEGLFAAFQLTTGVLTLSLSSGLKILSTVLSLFGTNLLEVTSTLAEYVIKFRDWVNEHTMFINTVDKISTMIVKVIEGIRDCAKAFLELEPVKAIIDKVKQAVLDFFNGINGGFGKLNIDAIVTAITNAFDKLEAWIKSLNDSENIGRDFVMGIVNGLKSGIGWIINSAIELAKSILQPILDYLIIRSPSKKAEEAGEDFIDGLVLGLQNGISKVVAVVKDVAAKMLDVFKNIDWSAIFVAGVIVVVLFFVKKFLDIMDKFTFNLKGISDGIQGVLGGVSGVLGSVKNYVDQMTKNLKIQAFTGLLEAIAKVVLAIAVLIGAITLLAKINTDTQGGIWPAVGALAAIAGILTAMIAIIGLIASKLLLTKASVAAVGVMAGAMIAISIALVIMAGALKRIASIDSDNLDDALSVMVVMMAGLTALLFVYGNFVKGKTAANMDKAAILIMKMAFAIGILALVTKLIAGLTWPDIGKAAAAIAGMELLFVGILFASKAAGKHASKAGTMLLKMAVAIGILAMTMKLIASLEWADIGKASVVLTGISFFFMGFVAISQFAGAHASKAGSMILKMSLAIGIMVFAIKAIAGISAGDITKAGVVMLGMAGIFATFILIGNLSRAINPSHIGSMVLKMALAIIVIAGAIKLIATISPGDVLKGIAVIAAIEVLFAGVIAASALAGEHADKAGTMLLKMSAALLIMVGAIAILSLLKVEDIIAGTVAITAILGMFALLMYTSQFSQFSAKPLTVMAVAIGILGAVLITLSCLKPEKVATATLAITAVLASFALLVAATSLAKSATGTILLITGVIVALAGVLYVLGSLPIESTLGVAASLSVLLLALSAALVIASAMGPTAFVGAGAMAVMVGVLMLLGLVLAALNALDVKPSIETAGALSILLLSLSAACLILAAVGAVAAPALVGAAALSGVIVILGTLMVGLGALMKYVPSLEDFLDRGIGVLEKIGYGLGSFIGNFLGGIAGGLTSGLPDIATDLSNFMTNMKGFIDGANSIDESAVNGVKTLAEAILILTAADVAQGLTSWITGSSSLADFAQQLVPFGTAMKQFSTEVSGIDAEAITKSAEAAKGLAEVATALPNSGGVAGFFAGENDLSSFATQLVPFGTALKQYGTAVEGINADAIKASSKAAEGLMEVAEAVPNSGGLLGLLSGENNLADFATQLVPFGTALKSYGNAVSGVDADSIKASAKAAAAIVEVAEAIPNEGGVVSWFTGDNSLADFATKLIPFGVAMKSYGLAVTGIDTKSIKSSAKAAAAIVEVANTIPNDGGIVSWFAGNNDLGSFASKLIPFGEAMKSYGAAVAGIDAGAITNSAKAASKIVDIINDTANINTSGVGSFVSSVNTLATANYSGFASAFDGVSAQLSSVGSTLATSIANGLKSNSGALTSAASTIVSSLKSALNSKANSMTSAGKKLSDNLAKGIKSAQSKVKSAGSNAAKQGAAGAKTQYSGFYSAGKYLVQGFANGISGSSYLATAKARAVAKATKDAINEALGVNSPAKELIPSGSAVDEGLAKGMIDNLSYIKDAGGTVADYAKTTISKAIAKVSDLMDGSLDSQPTIRPVVDLSDVEAGAGLIGDMLGLTPSVGVLASVGSISSMMNRRNQNGVNDDVVSAIDKLRNDLGNVGGDTYSINGITYDDGSNISNAVKDLVRAAKIGRRV